MAEVYKTITTDEELRTEISQNGYIPTDKVYVKTTEEKYKSKPDKVTDKTKEMDKQFIGIKRGGDMYILVGRSYTCQSVNSKDKPNGNFQKLSQEEFSPWVEEFSPDAFCFNPPEEEVI